MVHLPTDCLNLGLKFKKNGQKNIKPLNFKQFIVFAFSTFTPYICEPLKQILPNKWV